MDTLNKNTIPVSKAILIGCYLLMCYTAFIFYPKWKETQTEATLSWDVSGYYMYLPAIFIYNDIKHCAFKDQVLSAYQPTPDFQQAFIHQKSGNLVMRYSCGQAITMAPFFFIGNMIAGSSSSYPADGFSLPYQMCIGIGMFLYSLIGLFFLRKILIEYFSDKTVAILLIAYVFGSNYLNYSSIDQCHTHNSLFTIYTLLIYTTIQFYKSPTLLKSLAIGGLTGLATLIRPTDIVCLIIPLCWNISSIKDIRTRFSFFKTNDRKLFGAGIIFMLIVFIQPLYWKIVSGEWIIYVYQEQGFSWLHPHIKSFTSSYRCGWLRYCPIMFFPFIGLIPFIQKRKNLLAVILFFILNFYIVIAWDLWDYGGISGRAMVQSYPVLAFPFAALIEKVNRKKILSFIFYPLFILFIYLNIWWTYNAHKGSVQVIGIGKTYYWHMVGRWHADEFDKKYLDNNYSFHGYPQKFETIYENDFENDTTKNSSEENINDTGKTENRNIRIDEQLQSSEEYFLPNPPNIKKWIRAFADVNCMLKEMNVWKQAQFIVTFYNGDLVVQSNMIRVQRYLNDGETKNLFLDAKIPSEAWTKIGVRFWNAEGTQTSIFDNLRVITFDE